MKKHIPLFDRFSSIGATESIWMGICVFAMYLVLNGLVLFLMFGLIEKHIPGHLSAPFSQVFPVLYISMALGVTIGEIATFTLGWLFIMIAVAMFKGRRQSRALFGWLGIVHIPVTLYSALVLLVILLNPDQAAYAGISSLTSIEQLPAEIVKLQESVWFKWIRNGRHAALFLVVLCAIEVVHRICILSRSKAFAVLFAYVVINGFVQISLSLT